MAAQKLVNWAPTEVSSPSMGRAVKCVAALDVPYTENAHRFQTLSVYLPTTTTTSKLIGTPFHSIPGTEQSATHPEILVYVHGGAWRAYDLTSRSIEPTAACAFSQPELKIKVIIAINYTLSPSPTNAVVPIGYDPITDNHSDPSREAVHPAHIADVLRAFAFLRSVGLVDSSYILCGHSCGACISLQTVLQDPSYWGLHQLPDAPSPAASIVLNGLYDLTQLVYGLGPKHRHLRDDYNNLISKAFGPDFKNWEAASPARFDVDAIARRVKEGRAPRLVFLDHSEDDHLAPASGMQRMELQLSLVEGLKVARGKKSQGKHAEIWEQGKALWETINDVLSVLEAYPGSVLPQ